MKTTNLYLQYFIPHCFIRRPSDSTVSKVAGIERSNHSAKSHPPIYVQYIFSHFAGGDDVQQLCEAGEEEFLEIMALVGMASKPLHVRRLQKALQEWVQNPGTLAF
jgi:hypothetical protein